LNETEPAVTPPAIDSGSGALVEAVPLPLAPSIALVAGVPFTDMPEDLFIPPNALKIFLETFEGPLDLLLYLIQRQNIDILNIPIARVTDQYLKYLGMMQDLKLDLAAEYLLMAALLLEIKSRMLLPRSPEALAVEESDDPRVRLLEQLQEYARIKEAAQALDTLPRLGRDTFLVEAGMPPVSRPRPPPRITLDLLLTVMRDVLLRMELYAAHQITREPLSVRERMIIILTLLSEQPQLAFQRIYTQTENRAGVVVSLLAVLELAKELMLEPQQENLFGPILVLSKTNGITIPPAFHDQE